MKTIRPKRILSASTLALALSALLVSCSPSPHSVSKQHFEEKIARESGGKMKLASFEMVGGEKQTVNGQELFALDYKAELEYKEAAWSPDGQPAAGFKVYERQPATSSDGSAVAYKFHQKGEKEAVTGTVRVMKSGDGWRVVE